MTDLRLIAHRLRQEVDRANCSRRRVAAVLVKDGMIVGQGHNALPKGSCLDGHCPRGMMSYEQQPKDVGYAASGCTSVHAEVAAVEEAGLMAVGATCYTTEWPCPGCSAYLLNAGVAEVYVVDLRLFPPVGQKMTFPVPV